MTSPVEELLQRSRALGADPRNTNFAGGNTSAKGTATDPVTGTPAEVMWVKGSGETWAPWPSAVWRCCGWTGCGR